MVVTPGYAHLHANKILHLDKFLAPRQIVPPPQAGPVPSPDFVTGDKFAAPIKIVPRHSLRSHGAGATCVMLIKLCTRMAKSAPSASWRNTTSPYCRAVSFQTRCDRKKIRINGKILSDLTTPPYKSIFTIRTTEQTNDY